jgi:uncharacterized protein
MGRLVILVVLGLIVVGWAASRLRRARREDAPPAAPAPPRGAALPIGMVACAHCGLHLPESEAVIDGERRYCCDEHRRLGPR